MPQKYYQVANYISFYQESISYTKRVGNITFGQNQNPLRLTLTVTLRSKKYLRVSMRPRTISVRNNVFMLRSNTALKHFDLVLQIFICQKHSRRQQSSNKNICIQ